MATNRLDILKQMLAQDPGNLFARYGLAMELANRGDVAEAIQEYQTVLDADSSYVAAYYHGGQALEKMGRVDEARLLYERGMEACAKKGDRHTLGEIEAALSLLPV